MHSYQEQRARDLVKELERAGENCGLVPVQGIVVLRSPGSPYIDVPMTFQEMDLLDAVELGLLEKQKVTGSYEWEWYVEKKVAD